VIVMTDYAAIIQVHRSNTLVRTVYVRRAERNSNIDFLYHDVTKMDVGRIRLLLDDDPQPRWTSEAFGPRVNVSIARANGSVLNRFVDTAAEQGDVMTVALHNHPTCAFTLAELVPVDSDRGAIITLLGLADEKVGSTEGELLRNVAERFARFPQVTYE
jgi:hypothetical protein